MKEWTREEVERLVPEHSVVCTSIMFDDGSRKWEQHIVDALLQTRLDLETVKSQSEFSTFMDLKSKLINANAEISHLRSVLEQIANTPRTYNMPVSTEVFIIIAREALKGHDK